MAYRINERCVSCRMCDIHCPTKAIQYGNRRYTILADRCISCGTCQKYCNRDAIEPPEGIPCKAVNVPKEQSCDLVVLGGGGAGLVAAVRTAQLTGKRVIVLEKARHSGGSAWYAVGMRVSYTDWDEKRGLPDNREDDIRRVLKETHYLVSPELVERTVYGSGAFFNWLCQLGGTEKSFGYQDTPVGFGLDFLEKPLGARGGVGRWVVLKMREYCEKLNISVLTEHTAVQIETAHDAVCGVWANGPGGPVHIHCKACMLATGNFLYSPELIRRCAPLFSGVKFAQNGHYLPELTGDGFYLGEQAGAKMGYDTACLCAYGPTPVPMNPLLLALGESAEVVLVDLNGERWVNEEHAGEGNLQLLSHPDACTFAVFDHNTYLRILSEWVGTGKTSATQEPVTEEHVSEIDRFIDAEDHPLIRADSLTELAEKMAVPAERLAETIAAYNRYCEAGKDAAFHKEPEMLFPVLQPPFYAVRRLMHPDGANGGVYISSRMEVCAKKGGVVGGLYAGGDVTSGQYITDGRGRKDRIVSDLTWAFTSGFLAAEEIADYLGEGGRAE